MVLRDPNDPLNQSRGIMGPLEKAGGVQNNRGRLKQRFDIIKKLGQGTYGKVQLGIDKETGQEVAIKTIKKSKIETEADLIRIRREIQIMSSVRHPNIIHIYEVFENREKIVLVMEYAAGGELYDYLNERKTLQDVEARRIFRQVASAVYYCHKNKICHRDLKLENILLDENACAKIADFGLSNIFDDINLLKTFCGSPLYASPEIVKGVPYYGPEVDCWSLGVLLYTLVYGAMPFDGSNFKRLVKQISHGDYYEPKKPSTASPLIRLMLTTDPMKRASIQQVCANPWVNEDAQESCLDMAEHLANQTPVRLDILLSVAPKNNINQSQLVIQSPSATEEEGKGASKPRSPIPDKNDKKEPALKEETKTKPENEQMKRKKSMSKSKSKTAPLLELIKDVENEEDEQQEEKNKRSPEPQHDDTLSEISEIQTMAEDVGPKKKSTRVNKESAKSKGKEIEKVPETAEKLPKKESDGAKPTTKPETKKPVDSKPAEAPKPAESLEVTKKTETIEKIEPAAVLNEETKDKSSPSPKPAQKKKIIKPKEKLPEEVESKPDKKTSDEESIASKKEDNSASASTSEKDDKEREGSRKKKPIRQRSDSLSEASPTRIERRNSKVISQKTAELIQNLETKTSTGNGSSSDSGKTGPKKIVIPSFKVSDAKNRFETKPPKPSAMTASVAKSKAAFENKTQSSEKNGEVEMKRKESTEITPGELKEAKDKLKALKEQKQEDKIEVKEDKTELKVKAGDKAVNKEDSKVKEETKKPVSPKPKQKLPPKAQAPEQEVKSVVVDSGKGGPQKAMMLVKDEASQKAASSSATVSGGLAKAPSQKMLTKMSISPPAAKEQAAKKISSVINKIVSSSSCDKLINSDSSDVVKSEVEKFVNESGVSSSQNQRSEVSFPVKAAALTRQSSSKERIIPIQFEKKEDSGSKPQISSPPSSTVHVSRPSSKSESYKRSDSSLSRQNSSDTESSYALPPCRLEPIKKSPKEFLIPIKIESSGVTVTPKDEGNEAGDDEFRLDSRLRSGRFSKPKRYSSILSDSSMDEEAPSAHSNGRKDSTAFVGHSRSRSQGDEPETPSSTIKRYRMKRTGDLPLDRSDSFSSAEDDDEDAFEVLTAENLFSNLLDRVRNLTKRLNRDDGSGGSWQSPSSPTPTMDAIWGSSPLRELISRAPSEARSLASSSGPSLLNHRTFSRDPSVTVTITGGPSTVGSSNWRRSVSRDLSGDSDSQTSQSNPASRKQSGIAMNNDWSSLRSPAAFSFSNDRIRPSTYLNEKSETYGSPTSDNYHRTLPMSSSSNRTYNRALSNSEVGSYGVATPGLISRTLPLHKSLKTFDRAPSVSRISYASSGVGDHYSTGTRGASGVDIFGKNNRISSILGPPSHLVGLERPGEGNDILDSTNRGSLRSMRGPSAPPDRLSREMSLPPTANLKATPSEAKMDKREPVYISPSKEPDTKNLSIEEKMNRYHEYYRNLSQAPPKRFQFPSPKYPDIHRTATIGVDKALGTSQDGKPRPTTMYETSPSTSALINHDRYRRDSITPDRSILHGYSAGALPKRGLSVHAPSRERDVITPARTILEPSSGPSFHSLLKLSQGNQPEHPEVTQASNSVKTEQSISNFDRNSANSKSLQEVPNLRKFPNMSVKQHRPLNISSFPADLRAKSMCRLESAPVEEKSSAKSAVPKGPEEELQQTVDKKLPLKVDARARSVERITRLLERKSTPKEVKNVPAPPASEVNSASVSATPNKLKPSKSKSKFLQNLEKKWDKFTNKGENAAEGTISPCTSPTPLSNITPAYEKDGTKLAERTVSPITAPNSDDVGDVIDDNNGKGVSESELLRRALSPERKPPISKFGSSTVSYMLGKFKKFEEGSQTSKPPTAGPPKATRRTPYAGARSDTVLSLNRSASQKKPFVKSETEASRNEDDKTIEKSLSSTQQILKPSLTSKTILTNFPDSLDASKQSGSASMIPRLNKTSNINPEPSQQTIKTSSLPPESVIADKPTPMNSPPNRIAASAPRITSPEMLRSKLPSKSPERSVGLQSVTVVMKDHPFCSGEGAPPCLFEPGPLSPVEALNSGDSPSEKSEHSPSPKSQSILDDEESVSDRILRKSFYNRFNPNIGHEKKRSSASAPSLKPPQLRSTVRKKSNVSQPLSPLPPSTTTSTTPSEGASADSADQGRSMSPLIINKYNPNPLFKELIGQDFNDKDEIGKKAEYSRRVTSKLSKLLREIENDMSTRSLTNGNTSISSFNGTTNEDVSGPIRPVKSPVPTIEPNYSLH